MTSTAALALQAAVAIASTAFLVRYNAIFYLFDEFRQTSSVGAERVGTWVAISVVSYIAVLAALWGRRWLAAGLSLLVSAYLLVVAGILLHTDLHVRFFGIGSGTIFSPRYQNLLATPGLVGIAVLATSTSIVAAVRGRHSPASPFFSRWWLALGTGGLALVFSLVGDGNALVGSPPFLNPIVFPNGGIMDAFEVLWIVALVVALVWLWLDPRFGWAFVFLTTPVLAYCVSILMIATNARYAFGTRSWWLLQGQMIGIVVAAIVVAGGATYASRRLARSQ